jgi:hypothetical protein
MLGVGSVDALSLGQLGSVFINNGTANNGDWGIIYALEDTTFLSLVSGLDAVGTAVMVPGTGIANLNGLTMKAGQAIFGRFSTIQVNTGSVVAYKC